MRITHLGHAGLKIEMAAGTVEVDPWFSPEGAFQASWFQYPDNSHLQMKPDLFAPKAIVISHEHLDHIDPWFLSRVPLHVPVIIHRFPSPALRRKVLAAGSREVIMVGAWERVELAGGTVFFVPEESPANHDAAIVIEGDGQTVLNLNDARLSPVQFREIRAKVGGAIDLFSLQGAGASWYPMCYEYPDDKRSELSRRKRFAKFAYCARAIKIVEPAVVFPFAGPPCFLDPGLFRHNVEIDGGIFPDQQQVADWLVGRGINTVVLLPGDVWDLDERKREKDPVWDGFSFVERKLYLKTYQQRRMRHLNNVLARHPEPTESLWPAFEAYFKHLLTLWPYFNRKIGMRVGFEISGPGGGDWAVDFRPGREGVHDTRGECQYRYRFASRWLPPLLDGSVPWEDFFLSLRFEAWRDPDLYNDHLLGLLKFAHPEALAAVERFETLMAADERVVVHADGIAYRIQRRCPHAGNDLLETGEILPGRIIRCLAHHYEFSLDTGECLNGSCSPLSTELVEPTHAKHDTGTAR